MYEHLSIGKRECSTKEDYEIFSQMNEMFYNQDETEQLLKQAGCLPEKCRQHRWTVMNTFEASHLEDHPVKFFSAFDFEKGFVVNFVMTSDKVQVSKEIQIYGFSQFIADFGGYLGLLLGSSLLTIFDEVCLFTSYVKSKLYPNQ